MKKSRQASSPWFQCLPEADTILILTPTSLFQEAVIYKRQIHFPERKRMVEKYVVFITYAISEKLKCHCELGEICEYLWCFNFIAVISVTWNKRTSEIYHLIPYFILKYQQIHPLLGYKVRGRARLSIIPKLIHQLHL